MTWEPAGADRWTMQDEIGQRHVLLKRDERDTAGAATGTALFFELHGMTVHTYHGPADVNGSEELWPLGDPWSDDEPPVKHVRTEDRETALNVHTDDEAFAWLGRYADVEMGE